MNKLASKVARLILAVAVCAVFLSATGYGFYGEAFTHWESYVVIVGLSVLAGWPEL